MKKNDILSIANEELFSSLDIQDWNLRSFTQEIYENIGQLLSLVKIRIATLNPEKKEETHQIVEQSDSLLTKAIKDLRLLGRQLSPTEIIKKGFAESVRQEMERINRMGVCTSSISINGAAYRLEAIRELILFSILHHYIYRVLYKEKVKNMSLHISYRKKLIHIRMSWLALPANEIIIGSKENSSVLKRIRLINAEISTGRNKKERRIHIQVKRNNS